MAFEESFFKNKIWQEDRLLTYGFQESDGFFTFCQSFMDGRFEARIQVIVPDQAFAQVWDMDMEEEYHTFRVQHVIGSFIGEVRERYAEILHQVVQCCTVEAFFQSNQGNRLARYVQETFQECPDYPFTKAPDIATLRHAANQKWYGLVTQVPWTALGVENRAGTVEIINVKVETGRMKDLLAISGIYPAYHMSKKTWISMTLDDCLADEVVFDLVSSSRNLVAPRKMPSSCCCWIIPANPRMYDIDTELRSEKRILWTQRPKIKAGDTVCIYMTAPIQAIRYLCYVTKANVIEEDGEYMQLDLLRELADSALPLSQMKALGVKAVRGPRLATLECARVIEALLVNDSTKN